MSEWQPIETAPKDGREVLLAVPNSFAWPDRPPLWVTVGSYIVDGKYEWRGMKSGTRGPVEPAYWMPLPEPPSGHAEDL